jgi:hypothetical protein
LLCLVSGKPTILARYAIANRSNQPFPFSGRPRPKTELPVDRVEYAACLSKIGQIYE